jgi:uncharacterized protein
MFRFLRLGVMAVLCTLTVGAVDWKVLKPQGCTSDFAGVIDQGSRKQLEDYCRAVEQTTDIQIALVTIPSLEGEPIEDVTDTIFRAWQIGESHRGAGILMLLAIQEQRSRLEVGESIQAELPGGLDQRILLEMGPAVRRQQYGEALIAAASTIGDAAARAKHVRMETGIQRHIRRGIWDSIPWPVLAGALVLLLWLMVSGGTRGYSGSAPGNRWLRHSGFLASLASVTSRASWGSRGSGGFGGYDSGDSFGGLGGGPKGHGASGSGASNDW